MKWKQLPPEGVGMFIVMHTCVPKKITGLCPTSWNKQELKNVPLDLSDNEYTYLFVSSPKTKTLFRLLLVA
jgi:hypothetical protein